MALIITIILLGVVTFMAIAFLALSRRERGAVTTVTDTTSARLAADAALASAEAKVIANLLGTNNPNPFNFGLLVSTNYINAAGFQTDPADYTNFSNVSYQYSNGNPLSPADFLQNLANLWYSPRPPVFIPNPTNSLLPPDFRYYLDLNRNGRFDTNGWVANLDKNGNVIFDGSGNPLVLQVGDPEWIGILQRPDQPYGPNNPFVARFAYIAVPVGNTLDLNAIHNQVFDENNKADSSINSPPAGDTYFRNEGVGSWEINLAAFLAGLNSDVWLPTPPPDNTYYYYQYEPNVNQGIAFDDARALLAYRYNNDYTTLASVDNLYGGPLYGPGYLAFIYDNIDGYSDGPLQTNLWLPGDIPSPANDDPSKHWAGADNTNHFFTHQELFDTSKTAKGLSSAQMTAGNDFSQRLLNAGTNNSTYDRYTFYRLLSQLGTDSTPDAGKMNLNYDNLDPYIFVNNVAVQTNTGVASTTNFVPWTPLAFFNNAADRLLRAYTAQWRNSNPTNFATTFYTVTNFYPMTLNPSLWAGYPAFGLSGAPGVIPGIPVLVSNQFVYSAAVNRLLQLAANIYDATTNNTAAMGNNYPSVFRPLFSRDANGYGTNVYISGYTNVMLSSTLNDWQLAPPVDILTLSTTNLSSTGGVVSNLAVNVYGVPWIIGVKKGFPNFNQLYMSEVVQVTRKLEVTRRSTNSSSLDYKVYDTNQMYVMSITNNIGVSFWNSYSNYYPRPLTVYASDSLQMNLTNGANNWFGNTNFFIPAVVINSWPGSQWGARGMAAPGNKPNILAGSFYYTNWSYAFLPESVYRFGANGYSAGFYPDTNGVGWETNIAPYELPPLPQFELMTTNSLQAFILESDGARYHVIDYVQLRGPLDVTNVNQALADPDYPDLTQKRYQWSANIYQAPNPMTYGVYNQFEVSENYGDANKIAGNSWVRPPTMPASLASTPQAESEFFTGFFTPDTTFTYNSQTYSNAQARVQVPYTPTRTVYNYILWQANDPLVHYLASDLNYVIPGVIGWNQNDDPTKSLTTTSQNKPGDRFQPWGQNQQMLKLSGVDQSAYNLTYKDPLIWCPDNWDFPANKFPTVGWLGRVHRGTPWQTVYLKASDIMGVILDGAYVGTNTWAQWTGDTQLTYGQYFDAVNSAPTQDRLLFDLFTTAFNDNATRGTLSVNQGAGGSDPAAGLAAWSALFSGMVVLSNNAPVPLPSYTLRPTTTWMTINPAGGNGTNSPLWQMVANINGIRTNTALFPLGAFAHAGDILRVPALTEQSPFLYLGANAMYPQYPQSQYGISDEMYEWLPQQMMSLLRCSGSPRYVIYCYGQALKPAPDSIYTTGGPYFGMVTNYQIVSEIATRAVVRFNSTVTNGIATNYDGSGNLFWYSQPMVTNNNAVIESFNILPPD